MKQMENEMNVNVPLEVIKASEIEPKEVKWLWYPYGGYSVMLCGRFYMPAPWDNLSQSSQPRLPIPAVPPFCSPTHT